MKLEAFDRVLVVIFGPPNIDASGANLNKVVVGCHPTGRLDSLATFLLSLEGQLGQSTENVVAELGDHVAVPQDLFSDKHGHHTVV